MSMDGEGAHRPRAPRGALIALALALAAGPIGFVVVPRHGSAPHRGRDLTLADVAARSGCHLTEYDAIRPTNPPIGGRIATERFIARDGSYVGRRPPSPQASLHALMHGRVLIRYRPDLPRAQARLLDRFTRADREQLVTFEDTSRLRREIVATAYLTMMSCPGVTARTLPALRAFRDRRRGFGQTL
jgi:hypothetical protein